MYKEKLEVKLFILNRQKTEVTMETIEFKF